MNKNIRQVVLISIQRFFRISFLISFILLFLIFLHQTVQLQKDTESFLKDFIKQVAKSAEISGDFFQFQSEVDRFSNSLEKYKFNNFKIELYLNDKLVAQSRKGTTFAFTIQTFENIQLNSGDKLVFKLYYDAFNSVTIYLVFGSFVFVQFLLLYFLLRLKLFDSLNQLILPLEHIAKELTLMDIKNNQFKPLLCKTDLSEILILEKSINVFFLNIIESQSEIIELKKSEALINLSRQVAHDIRSPISALNFALSNLNGISQEKHSLIKNATIRINEIANDLLIKSKSKLIVASNSEASELNESIMRSKFVVGQEQISTVYSQSLSNLIFNIVEEKKAMYSDLKSISIIADVSIDIKINLKINLTQLSRVISNLVNNAVDACDSNEGEIIISVREYPESIQFVISDNGSGIPENIVDSIGTNGFTTKFEGNGLGLSHAKQFVESNGGHFSIASKMGVGTSVNLIFPIV